MGGEGLWRALEHCADLFPLERLVVGALERALLQAHGQVQLPVVLLFQIQDLRMRQGTRAVIVPSPACSSPMWWWRQGVGQRMQLHFKAVQLGECLPMPGAGGLHLLELLLEGVGVALQLGGVPLELALLLVAGNLLSSLHAS